MNYYKLLWLTYRRTNELAVLGKFCMSWLVPANVSIITSESKLNNLSISVHINGKEFKFSYDILVISLFFANSQFVSMVLWI